MTGIKPLYYVGIQLRAEENALLVIEYYEFEFTLRELILSQKYYYALELKSLTAGFRFFQIGTEGLCRTNDCKVRSHKSWKMIVSCSLEAEPLAIS